MIVLMDFFYFCSYSLPFIMVLFSVISVFYFRSQVLISLLLVELSVLGLFMMIVFFFCELNHPVSISFYLLILGACEASLGLSLLVSMGRFKGNDMLSSVGTYKF